MAWPYSQSLSMDILCCSLLRGHLDGNFTRKAKMQGEELKKHCLLQEDASNAPICSKIMDLFRSGRATCAAAGEKQF